MTPVDTAGLTRLAKVVGDKNYPTIFVCPEGLDLSNYKKIYPNFEVFEFDKKWFKGLYEYSQLCMQYEFYNRFSDYEYMFMYQLDSYIWEDRIAEVCKMGYDYIGGPIFSELSNWNLFDKETGIYSPKVGNGGCGWRKIETFKDICDPNGEFRQTYNITDEYTVHNTKLSEIKNAVLNLTTNNLSISFSFSFDCIFPILFVIIFSFFNNLFLLF